MRRMLRGALEGLGYEVVEAENGHIGVLTHQATPAALVITDILMPEQEGLETIRTFRTHFPDVKIIAMSGGGRMQCDFLTVAARLGAQYTFHKPFNLFNILQTVGMILEEPCTEEALDG